MELGTYTLLTKLILGDNCHGWSPTIHRMVPHQPEDGHPPEGIVLKTGNLAFTLYSQKLQRMITAMDGHLPSLGWSPTNLRMVTHQKEVYYRFGIWHLYFTHKNKTKWQLPLLVTYQPKLQLNPLSCVEPQFYLMYQKQEQPLMNFENGVIVKIYKS